MRFQQPKGFLPDDVTSRVFLVSGPFRALVALPTALRILEANQQTRPHRATANASINASLKPLIMPHRRRGRAHFHSFFRYFAQNCLLLPRFWEFPSAFLVPSYPNFLALMWTLHPVRGQLTSPVHLPATAPASERPVLLTRPGKAPAPGQLPPPAARCG